MKPRRRSLEPTPVREILPGLIRKVRSEGRGAVSRLQAVWPDVVGAPTAGRTRILGVESGQVRVAVASAAVKHDLSTFRREEVLAELRRRLPDLRIRAVSYRVGSVP